MITRLLARLNRPVLLGSGLVVIGLGGFAGFRLVETRIEAEVYRQRLADLDADYADLRQRYDDAVRRTAVSELVVRDGVLSVSVRTAAGILETFPTPFDPEGEIYVDYVVSDGRLWIRRVFDERTAPGDAVVIDPAFASIDWSDPAVPHGKAAYRPLAEGRWIVTVTGDGSLGLAPAPPGLPVDLSPPPPVREYEPVSVAAADSLRSLGFAESVRALAAALGRRD